MTRPHRFAFCAKRLILAIARMSSIIAERDLNQCELLDYE
jgi:hypothetical protein